MRTWREAEALRTLDGAVTLLEGDPAETANLAAHCSTAASPTSTRARSGRARLDLIWCQRVAADGGDDLNAAKALHNLGYCELLAGDIPAALQLFDAAADTYRLHCSRQPAGSGHGQGSRAAGGRPGRRCGQ